jgi:hypothetical protein
VALEVIFLQAGRFEGYKIGNFQFDALPRSADLFADRHIREVPIWTVSFWRSMSAGVFVGRRI